MSAFRRRLLYKKPDIIVANELYIIGQTTINVETYQLYAYDNHNNLLSNVQWSILSGSSYATID